MKRFLSCIVAYLMSLFVIPSTVNALSTSNETLKLSTSSDSQTDKYYIFYKDIDITKIDKEAADKHTEYIYTLYEQNLTQTEFERLSTEYYNKVRLELLKVAYSEKAEKVLKELGVNNEDVFCSMYSPTIICPLTEEQKTNAEKSELIESISAYIPIALEPYEDKLSYSTKDEFIKIITGGKETSEFFGEGIKIDAELNCKKGTTICDYFIIYGLKSNREISNAISKLASNSDLRIITSDVENRSGTLFSISSDNINTKNQIYGFVFVDDEYPSWVSKQSIKTFSQSYNFNPSKYIISLGDTNGDFLIDSSDASDVLKLYSELSTTSNLKVKDEQFKHYDVNSDGFIDSSDASAILSYYAFLSTGGDSSLKDFLNV